jgi:hypothetical protein
MRKRIAKLAARAIDEDGAVAAKSPMAWSARRRRRKEEEKGKTAARRDKDESEAGASDSSCLGLPPRSSCVPSACEAAKPGTAAVGGEQAGRQGTEAIVHA